MKVSIGEVYEALSQNNVNTGGAYIEKSHMANFIRGEGLVKSLDDIRNIVVKNIMVDHSYWRHRRQSRLWLSGSLWCIHTRWS